MGRRKKAVKKVVKNRRVLAKVFKCILCNHADSVSCKLDHRSMTGTLTCNFCDAKFHQQINSLSEPIDLFTDWLDEATELQAQVVRNSASGGRRIPVPAAGAGAAAEDQDELTGKPKVPEEASVDANATDSS